LAGVEYDLEQTERRKEIQRVTIARGSLENERSKRFRRLSRVLHRFRELDVTTRERATELLRRLSSQSDASLTAMTPAWLTPPPDIPQVEDPIDLPPGQLVGRAYDGVPSYDLDSLFLDDSTGTFVDYSWEDEQDALSALAEDIMDAGSLANETRLHSELNPLTACQVMPLCDMDTRTPNADDTISPEFMEPPPSIPHVDVDITTRHENTSIPPSFSLNEIVPPISDAEIVSFNDTTYPPNLRNDLRLSTPTLPVNDDVPNMLASLYLDYRRTKSKLATLPTPTVPSMSTPIGADPDVQADVVMSKAQLQLTVEEGRFWEGLFWDAESTRFSESTLATLTRTSSVMYDSYQKRTNTPTARNYDECREIIQAMGILCIDASGVEAEALASSLVMNGFADYVASEDTVRIITTSYNIL
jgi:flap endonuclease-1